MHKIDITKRSLFAIGAFVLALLASPMIWAHGGASVDTDQCRIFVGPHLVHFTAYQPQLSGTTEFCGDIPELGPTTLVFDYEGKALRDMSVEMEVTKEPEGSRVAYLAPSTHPTGTFNTTINFNEPSKYLAHVTLVNEGERIDAHIPFKVGTSKTGLSSNTIIVILVVLVTGLYLFYLSSPGFKAAVDKILKKKSV